MRIQILIVYKTTDVHSTAAPTSSWRAEFDSQMTARQTHGVRYRMPAIKKD